MGECGCRGRLGWRDGAGSARNLGDEIGGDGGMVGIGEDWRGCDIIKLLSLRLNWWIVCCGAMVSGARTEKQKRFF